MAKKSATAKPTRWFPIGNTPDPSGLFLGIDPSLSSCGVCLLENHSLKESYTLAPADGVVGPERLAWFHRRFLELLGECGPALRGVAVEGYSYGSSNNREALAELGGVLRLVLYQFQTPTLIVATSTLRKFILPAPTGAGKDHTMLATFKRWGVEFATSDECDAHGLARLAAARATIEAGVPWPNAPARMLESAKTATPLIHGRESAPNARPRRR